MKVTVLLVADWLVLVRVVLLVTVEETMVRVLLVVVGSKQVTVALPSHRGVPPKLQPVYSLQGWQPGKTSGQSMKAPLMAETRACPLLEA